MAYLSCWQLVIITASRISSRWINRLHSVWYGPLFSCILSSHHCYHSLRRSCVLVWTWSSWVNNRGQGRPDVLRVMTNWPYSSYFSNFSAPILKPLTGALQKCPLFRNRSTRLGNADADILTSGATCWEFFELLVPFFFRQVALVYFFAMVAPSGGRFWN